MTKKVSFISDLKTKLRDNKLQINHLHEKLKREVNRSEMVLEESFSIKTDNENLLKLTSQLNKEIMTCPTSITILRDCK